MLRQAAVGARPSGRPRRQPIRKGQPIVASGSPPQAAAQETAVPGSPTGGSSHGAGRSAKRLVCRLVGYVAFAIGLAGLALPVLPTTVFWIVAAACFAHSSPAMYRRILAWPGIGRTVDDFISHGVISRKGKIAAVCGMAVATVLVALSPMAQTATLIALGGIAIGATYVLTRPESVPPARP